MRRQTKLRDLIGILKDKASLSKAALLSKPNTSSPQLALLRVTTHEPSALPDEKHVAALLSSGHGSRATASTCIEALMDRLHNTRNSTVALKCLITVHTIIRRGTFILQDQLSVYPFTGGRNYLNLSHFRDQSSPEAWELSSWVRWYAKLLEQILATSRVLGFFLCSAASCSTTEKDKQEKLSGVLSRDLLADIDSLVGLMEEILRAPDPHHVQGNKLVYEVMGLTDEDYRSAQKEISIRVSEFNERLGSLSFGESIELVCALKRLEEYKERLMSSWLKKKETTTNDLFWSLISETRKRIGMVKEYRDEGKLVNAGRRERGSESDRFQERASRWGEGVRFPSGRLNLDRLRLRRPSSESLESLP